MLGQLDKGIGAWLSLVGAKLKAYDLISLNLATNYVASTEIEKLKKNDLRDDIKTMKSDIRLQDRIIKDVETSVKEMDRQLHQDLKQLEEELDINIRKALSNPLAGTK